MDDAASAGYDPSHKPPNTPPKPVYTQRCGLNQPDALTVDEGISVGYLDYYNPVLEGQSIDVTGVKDGRYYLVVRSNGSGLIHESNYKNNGASDQILLSHPSGAGSAPVMKILTTCRDGDRCPQPLTLRVSGPTVLPSSARSLTLRVSVSAPSKVDARLQVGARVLSRVVKQLGAGGSQLVLSVPQTRAGTATVTVRASGPGLQPAAQKLSVALR